MVRWPIAVLLVLCLTDHGSAQEGRLQRVREAVAAAADDPAGRSSGKACDGDDDTAEFYGALFRPVLWATLVPFWGPAHVLGDDWHRRLYFPRHPYPGNYPGYLLMSPAEAAARHETYSEGMPRRSWGGWVSLEDGNDFSGLNRAAGRLRLDTRYRVGLLAGWNFYQERLGHGRRDRLAIGDVNATVRLAQNEVASLYAGVGVRTLEACRQTDYGVNFVYGGDWFPVRPVVVNGQLDVGTLGSAGVFRGRATVGAVYHGCEFFTGYDFLRVGGENLQGPLVGVRFWF